MSAKKVIRLGFKTLLVTIVVGISFIIGATVSGIGRGVPAPTGAAAAAAATSPAITLLLLFIASLIQAIVATYIVLQADWSGWKVAARFSCCL